MCYQKRVKWDKKHEIGQRMKNRTENEKQDKKRKKDENIKHVQKT